MSFLWTSPLGPIGILALGAGLLILGGRRFPERVRVYTGAYAPALLAGLALALWALLRFQAEQPPELWIWRPPLGSGVAMGIQLNGWAWLAGLGILLLGFVGVTLPGWRRQQGFFDPRLWALLTIAAALLVILAHTWISLLCAWVLMTAAIGFVAGRANAGSSRAWSMGMLSSLLLLATPLFNGGDTLGQTLGNIPLNAQGQLLLVLAAMIHLGVYPFHLWLTPQALRSPGRQLAVHLVPGLAALHLLGRFDLPLLVSQAWVPLAVAALFGSALAAWADPDPRRTWAYVLINRSTWAALALGLTQLPAPAGAVFPLIVLALGAALWAIARVAQWRYRWNLPLWLGFAVLFGLPLTPGFAMNLSLSRLAGSVLGLPGWILILLAQALFVAAMVRRQPPPDEPGSTTDLSPRVLVYTFALMAGLALWWGLFPGVVANMSGIMTPAAGAFAAMRAAGIAGWLTLLIPLALGLFIAANDERFFGHLRGWQINTARVAGLGWVFGAVGRFLHSLAISLGIFADLVDGAGQFGWVLLALLLAWLLLAA